MLLKNKSQNRPSIMVVNRVVMNLMIVVAVYYVVVYTIIIFCNHLLS